jgi:hypothetical protein
MIDTRKIQLSFETNDNDLFTREGTLVGFVNKYKRTISYLGDEYYAGQKPSYTYYGAFKVERIIFNDPATIVFWKDGTKTVVKCSDGETFNPYYGFCAAVTKKALGNNSRIRKTVDTLGYYQTPYEEPQKKKKGKKAKNG